MYFEEEVYIEELRKAGYEVPVGAFSPEQLSIMTYGLSICKDIKELMYPWYSPNLMEEIMLNINLHNGMDISRYFYLDISTIREISRWNERNLNIYPYLEAGYEHDQLQTIRSALCNSLDVSEFSPTMRTSTMVLLNRIQHELRHKVYVDQEELNNSVSDFMNVISNANLTNRSLMYIFEKIQKSLKDDEEHSVRNTPNRVNQIEDVIINGGNVDKALFAKLKTETFHEFMHIDKSDYNKSQQEVSVLAVDVGFIKSVCDLPSEVLLEEKLYDHMKEFWFKHNIKIIPMTTPDGSEDSHD